LKMGIPKPAARLCGSIWRTWGEKPGTPRRPQGEGPSGPDDRGGCAGAMYCKYAAQASCGCRFQGSPCVSISFRLFPYLQGAGTVSRLRPRPIVCSDQPAICPQHLPVDPSAVRPCQEGHHRGDVLGRSQALERGHPGHAFDDLG